MSAVEICHLYISPGHALNHWHLNHEMRVGFTAVMTHKIVARRNVKMADFHRVHDNIENVRLGHFLSKSRNCLRLRGELNLAA